MNTREGYDLFNRWGRRHLYRRWKRGDGIPWRLVRLDTLSRFSCFWSGHRAYQPDPALEPAWWACRVCGRTISNPGA